MFQIKFGKAYGISIYQNFFHLLNRKTLDSDLRPFFKRKTRKELMEEFISKNIPVGFIQNLKEVFENDAAKQLILDENIEGIDTKRVKTVVFKISD